MSWSLRRVVVVLTAVAACGTVACLQTAFAQKARRSARPVIINPECRVPPPPAAPTRPPSTCPGHRRPPAHRGRPRLHRRQALARSRRGAPARPRRPPGQVRPAPPQGAGRQRSRRPHQRPGRGQPPPRRPAARGPRSLQGLQGRRPRGRRVSQEGQGRRHHGGTAGRTSAWSSATTCTPTPAARRPTCWPPTSWTRGDFRTAARYYGLLLTRAGGADAVPPTRSSAPPTPSDQADDKAYEDLMWQTARSRGIREIKLRRRNPTVAELQDYLAGIAPPADPVARQWTYFLGDASHTGRGDGGPAFMWRQLVGAHRRLHPELLGRLERQVGLRSQGRPTFSSKASESLTQVNQPVLPPQFPVAATSPSKDGKKHSLVVYPHPFRHRRPRPGQPDS